jgi:hypothetical protein
MSKFRNRKTVLDGHTFDSQAESRYYLLVKEMHSTGQIQSFKLQPRYILQDKFKKNGKPYRKIEYVADFEVLHLDGSIEVIDVKGVKTEAFKIKHKLFEKAYPDLTLTIVK